MIRLGDPEEDESSSGAIDVPLENETARQLRRTLIRYANEASGALQRGSEN